MVLIVCQIPGIYLIWDVFFQAEACLIFSNKWTYEGQNDQRVMFPFSVEFVYRSTLFSLQDQSCKSFILGFKRPTCTYQQMFCNISYLFFLIILINQTIKKIWAESVSGSFWSVLGKLSLLKLKGWALYVLLWDRPNSWTMKLSLIH